MSKFKLFITNFIVFGLGSVINKIIPFVMLPIVTRLMPNSMYFGLNDLVNTAISFGSALAIMGMYDAVFRLFFDKDEEKFKKTVCSTALCFTLGSSVLVFLILLLFKDFFIRLIFNSGEYGILMYITAVSILVGATNSILAIPTRALNQGKVFIVLNVACSIISYSLAIPLLIKECYLVALPLAGIVSCITNGAVFWYLNQSWFEFKLFDYAILKQLLKIALPCVPIFLIYWIFNSCDRLFISKYFGNDQVGIYAVGSKIASASQLIYAAFAGGWQYFAFSTMDDEMQVENNSKIYEYLGAMSFVATCFMCAWSYEIFKLLFIGDYVKGYTVAPILFIGPLLLMLYQTASNQFLVVKKTWPAVFTLLSGAILNIYMNIYITPNLGIEGTAVANMLGYVMSNIVCVAVLYKMNLIILSKKFYILSISMVAFMLLWRFMFRENFLIGNFVAIVYLFFALVLYKDDVLRLLNTNN